MIKIRNLFKVIDDKEILKNLNININKGDFVSVVGPSGSGKTTLLNIILSISMKSSGTYRFNEENIEDILNSTSKIRSFRKSVGIMSTFSHLLPNLDIKDNILLPTIISDLNLNNDYYDSLIEKLKIDNIMKNEVSSLSSGEKQRVLLARALILNPTVLVADEPTSNLDKENALNMIDILCNLNEQNKTTIIIATHDDNIYNKTNLILRIEDGNLSEE
ncbi:ATP-binding cassette domain-containing protein [bacterium]|jgi:ABC-type lipoprotein export system ATPase subunit|nr:ATP-binding cassette domain-containing protein [bacterium]MBT3795199.1 ATP-binding cassette domain-containing protein [bacterium]MBT4634484.1 ATP-binding cassette domain-containing protein [bacterium]